MPRLSKPKSPKITQEIVDPFALVNKKLTTLKVQSKQLTQENYKEFFVELSEAIREFLSYTTIPLALELPTRDIIIEMKKLLLNSEIQEIIISVLKNTDRAKYAKQIFAQDRIDEVLNDSFKLTKLIQKKHDREQENELRKS